MSWKSVAGGVHVFFSAFIFYHHRITCNQFDSHPEWTQHGAGHLFAEVLATLIVNKIRGIVDCCGAALFHSTLSRSR